jgi:hypothetical protein
VRGECGWDDVDGQALVEGVGGRWDSSDGEDMGGSTVLVAPLEKFSEEGEGSGRLL